MYRALAHSLASSLAIDPTLYPSLQPLLQQTALPPADLSGTAVGLRLQLALHRIDLDFFYHYGYDANPRLQIDPALSQTLSQIDPTTADASTLSSTLLSGSRRAACRRRMSGAITPAWPGYDGGSLGPAR